jgi:signal transduction histidine kinase
MTDTIEPALPTNRRLLVVDDNEAIHGDFGKILSGSPDSADSVDDEAAALFGEAPKAASRAEFEVEFASQGQEALEKVVRAREARRPFAMAFVDMRMPPGWDGLTTITELWKADPELQTVICTAYSDRSWEEIQAALSTRERWLVLKKPFDKIEVLQMAHSLTEKWNLARLAATKVDALERMVTSRTQDLVHAQRVKHEFLMNASHELLTPMNGICGFLELLSGSNPLREQADYILEAQACADRLHGLIRQILEFNRAEAGQLDVHPVPFAPAELLRDIAAEHAPGAAAKGLSLLAEAAGRIPAEWIGPKQTVHTALGLLVDNAIKFTPQGGVTLEVGPAEEGLEFVVRDTGIGLTPQQLDWIRIPFAQVDGGATRRSTGIGIGLPLAHRLARAAGGSLTLSAEPNRGLRASLTVRAYPANA